MKPRKIVLLSLIAVLLCVYIIQLVTIDTGSVEKVVVSGEPDRLVIESKTNGRIVLTKKNEVWYLGENQQYDTLESEVNILVDALSGWSVLQTVSRGGDEVLYGLDDDAKISVSAYQHDELLTQFDVGKDASATRQSYIRMAGEKDILLISDSFNNVFNITPDDVRVRSVYTYDYNTIVQAYLITAEAGVIQVIRDEDGDWAGFIKGEYQENMTSEGIESWISSISILNSAGWLPDDYKPAVDAVGIIMFQMEDGSSVTNSIYPVEGDEEKFIGTSSESPYAFYMSSYTKGKFLRTADDFAE